jgi:hypothetical protein
MELPNFKKILLLVAITISFYIIYRLVHRRQILKELNPTDDLTEGFDSSMPTLVNTANLAYKLKEYQIFSSWNSCAQSDNNVSLQQLEKVLLNGCRFLDFEVYFIDGKPVVGFSKSKYQSNESIQQIDSDRVIPFIDVCNMITSAKCPNPNDPLFLHFRIKSNNVNIFEKMAENFISSGIKTKLPLKKVDKNTLLSELQNKIIVVVDKTYVPSIQTESCKNGCKTSFTDMIQMYSGTSDLPSMRIQQKLVQRVLPLSLTTDSETNTSALNMVTHEVGVEYDQRNVDKFASLIIDHSIQIIPHKFYSDDSILTEYKNFFSDHGHAAFITMAVSHHSLVFN